MMRLLILNLAFAVAAAASPTILSSRLLTPIVVGVRRATNISQLQQQHAAITGSKAANTPHPNFVVRGGASDVQSICTGKPCSRLLRWAYSATGLATTAAWSTMVYTTIRSNQPQGAMMPCWQHGAFARVGAMAAAPLIIGSFASLAASVSNADSWDELGTPSFRRHNLALTVTGIASALWVGFAPLITRIPGSNPLASHQAYQGVMRAGLIGCYGSAAALAGAVWARSLPDDVRHNPLSWPVRIADGVSKSIVSMAPKNVDNPVQVKYALLTSTFLFFTGIQTLCNMPISVIPSWTSRRLSRAFPIWTFLGAVTAMDLKEATENGRLLIDDNYRYLSNGVKGFGTLYLGARAGAILFDPSFPDAFHAVTQVPGLAVAAIVLVGLTLRSDKE
mmetsp:Transcript_13998/g.30485  ORF Transcript_13998/g.30485 Transcript_13998/m.30485 type:complete len:392 (+) Transcript_13998:3-1178(+)